MLWLALHFPKLALEALGISSSASAVVAKGRVVVCDDVAEAAGVQVGQPLSTALGLVPHLAVHERQVAREVLALEALAQWAGRFTPTLSLQPPDGLWLEIGGCLRLFGGIEAICRQVVSDGAARGWQCQWSVAPTPLAASWLARSGSTACLETPQALDAVLAATPCTVTGWSAAIQARLEAFGLRRLGELRALPAASLRQRLGCDVVDDVLRAWGDLLHRPVPYVFPECFALSIELPARVVEASALLFAGQRLLAALTGWLQARQCLLQQACLELGYEGGETGPLLLRPAQATADEGRLIRLLREHLERLVLRHPVLSLRLVAEAVVPRPGTSDVLFASAATGEGRLACLERLQARLGEAAVLRLVPQADYRPECAAGMQALCGTTSLGAGEGAGQESPPAGKRPLWLLPAPQALPEYGGQPQWYGALRLLSRAERLESGWWDEGEAGAAGDVRRDYFVACNAQGQWAWVFRDAQGWFLHGLFA